jgi:glucose-1-phosphatase
MPIKAIIWDIGGVIARTEDQNPRNEFAVELGVTRDRLEYLFFSGPEGTRAQKGEISRDELMTYIRGELNLSPDAYPDLEDRFFAGDQVDYELVDFIRDLKTRYKIGIISNAWPEVAEVLDRWGIRDAFEHIVGSGDVGIMKPDPAIYHLSLDGLGIHPEEAVFVDDFLHNIEGAHQVGMKGVHFKNPDQAIADLNAILKE